MPLASAAKPAVQNITWEIIGPWNHRSIPVYVHLLCKWWLCTLRLRCIDPRLSNYLPEFLEIFYVYGLKTFHSILQSSRLSGNSPDCPNIINAVQKSSGLYRNLLDFPEIFKTVQKTFQTVWQSSRLSRNHPYCSKSSRLSGNLQNCLAIFKTVWQSSRLSRNLSDCPEIFQTAR